MNSDLKKQMQASIEKQRQMQQIQADADSRFQKAIEIEQCRINASERWWMMVKGALKFASPLGMGCTASVMRSLFNASQGNVTMYEFALLSNNLETRSMNDLDLHFDTYFELMEEVQMLSEQWNKMANEIKAVIAEDIQKEIAVLNPLPNGVVRHSAMRPGKAEA